MFDSVRSTSETFPLTIQKIISRPPAILEAPIYALLALVCKIPISVSKDISVTFNIFQSQGHLNLHSQIV